MRVSIKAEFFKWARERSGKSLKELSRKFKNLAQWEKGKMQPTFKQLEDFAKRTYTPLGTFFESKPPVEEIPIPDLRTIKNADLARPSSNLLDTIYLCQNRQNWYSEFIRAERGEKLNFVGSVDIRASVEKVAETMGHTLSFTLEERNKASTWEDALRIFRHKIQEVGIMVMTSGIVGNNTSRKLDINEFRGFALIDEFAPLVFVNSADSRPSAQMFTLVHHLAHIWIGKSALSNTDLAIDTSNKIEDWCIKLANEFLLPLKKLKREDIAKIGAKKKIKTSMGEQFIRDVIASTLEGHTRFTDAFYLLGIKKIASFDNLAKKYNQHPIS